MQPHVWQLRSRRCYRVLERAFVAGCDRFGARIAHFSVQHDHVHLVVEAEDSTALARAMQGLSIRMAKGLNKLMRRSGRVFGDRYHARSLRTPTEVRAALVYVYGNARKHLARFGARFSPGWIDEFSSGAWFDGWLDAPGGEPPAPVPVGAPTVWLLTRGWRERGGGPIRPDEAPPSVGGVWYPEP